MFESLLSYSTTTTITIIDAILAILVSFVVGGIISFTYMKTHTDKNHSQNFALTVVLLPAVISAIIMLIGSDIARAFSLAGAFSIIRFRSAPGDPKDIAYVLFAMAAGLAGGVGLLVFAQIFTILLCLVMYVLSKLKFGEIKHPIKRLKITIPEDLDYEEALNPILDVFTESSKLTNVKTTAMGSLYQLTYEIVIDDKQNIKEFIDELRCRNGNLNISLNLLEVVGFG